MAVNPATPVYGTDKLTNLAAVVDVDISAPNPNHADRVSAKALVVTLAAGGTGGGAAGAGYITVGAPPGDTAATLSGTITLGATAQQLAAANANRKGWAVQNQSMDYLYVRGRGAGGAVDATQDQNSIRIAPGQEYLADYVTANALSIIGPTTGQAFWAREW